MIEYRFTENVDFKVIKNTFSIDWGNAWDGIVGTFKKVFEKLEGYAKAPLNAVIKMVNSVIKGMNKLSFDIPDWVPGVGGESFGVNIPTIPMLAKGGIVDAPTLAMVGEAGKEAVVPLENNTQGLDLLAEKLMGRLGGVQGGSSDNSSNIGDRPIIINLEVGGSQFGRAVIDGLNKMSRQTGKRYLLT